MTELATVVTVNHIQPIIDLVCNAVTSSHTKRAYTRALTDFVVWYTTTGQTGLNKATVQAHVTALRNEGVSASSINQRITAIRKLAMEAADNELIDTHVLDLDPAFRSNTVGVRRIKSLGHDAFKVGGLGCGMKRSAVVIGR